MCIRTHLLVLASLLLLLTACTSQRPQAASATPNLPQIFTSTQHPEDTRSGALPEYLNESAYTELRAGPLAGSMRRCGTATKERPHKRVRWAPLL
jgi:isochorismate synthase EntC